MRISKLFLIGITMSFLTLYAQQKVTGKIIDAETGDVLVGGNILVENTISGATSDEYGYFSFSVEAKSLITVTASFVGYETTKKEADLSKGKDVELSFIMYKKEIQTEQVVVTASKTEQTIGDIAGRVELISKRTIEATPNKSVDDLFRNVAGLFVDRDLSFLDHNAVVNIRGVTSSEQGRVLALVDGLPINKSDGGTVNWNRINANDVERVEIFKGPGSSIYGSDAMGGVINFITKKGTRKGININAGVSYATYNTTEGHLGVEGRLDGFDQLYYRISAFDRRSDGYDTIREEFREEFDIKSRMTETGVDAAFGYNFTPKTNLQVNYNFYDDLRGSGYKVEEENYMKHKTNYGSLLFNTEFSGIKLNTNVFYQMENYLRISEKYSVKNGKVSYSRYNVDADRLDFGANANLVIPFSSHTIVTGVDMKIGSIDGSDIYQTSTDVVTNKGQMLFLSAFAQDEWSILDNFKLLASVRVDNVKFSDGEFVVVNPTSATDFMNSFSGKLSDYDWTAVTPRFSAKYLATENLNMYAAYSQGFRAASLDDLTRSGLIRLGFKLANPELQPEKINNIEFGLNYDLDKQLFIMPSIYLMNGTDYMAYIATGESIMGGKKKVIKKDNISEVQIFGGDIDVKYFLNDNISFFVNYTHTKSEIKKYTGSEELEGKELIYTPNNLANFGITLKNPYINTTVNVHYQSEQFTSEDNARVDQDGYNLMIDESVTVDLKLWKRMYDMITLSIDVQNLFDKQELSSYDMITPGRMIMVGLSYGL